MFSRFFILVIALWAFTNSSTAQLPKSFYKKLIGSIDKYPVVMDLLVMDSTCSGWYYYEKHGIPIRIAGTRNNSGIELREEDSKGNITGTFRGSIGNDGFNGTWTGSNGYPLPFSIREDYSRGSVKMKPEAFTNHYEVKPEMGHEYAFSYLLLEDVSKTVRDSVYSNLYGVKPGGKDPEAALKKLIKNDLDSALADYKSEVQLAIEDTSLSSYMFNWSYSTFLEPVFNERDLLSIAYNSYMYTGGAHGMYGTSNYVFDTKTGRAITLDKIFLPGYDAKLTKLLEQQFRKDNEVAAGQSLSDFGLFVEKIEPTENFFIAKNGIGFTYVPYEIGPYAAGQIEIIVPYTLLNELINPKGPVGWAVKK